MINKESLKEKYDLINNPLIKPTYEYIQSLYRKGGMTWSQSYMPTVRVACASQNYLYLPLQEHPQDAIQPDEMESRKVLRVENPLTKYVRQKC